MFLNKFEVTLGKYLSNVQFYVLNSNAELIRAKEPPKFLNKHISGMIKSTQSEKEKNRIRYEKLRRRKKNASYLQQADTYNYIVPYGTCALYCFEEILFD